MHWNLMLTQSDQNKENLDTFQEDSIIKLLLTPFQRLLGLELWKIQWQKYLPCKSETYEATNLISGSGPTCLLAISVQFSYLQSLVPGQNVHTPAQGTKLSKHNSTVSSTIKHEPPGVNTQDSRQGHTSSWHPIA